MYLRRHCGANQQVGADLSINGAVVHTRQRHPKHHRRRFEESFKPMTACSALLFRSALVAILAHAVGGNEFRDGSSATAVSPPRSQAFESAPESRSTSSRVAADNRFEAGADVDTGPDPFFADLEVAVPQQENVDLPRSSRKKMIFSVEVYEVQSGGLGRKWREARMGWTYKVQQEGFESRVFLVEVYQRSQCRFSASSGCLICPAPLSFR